MKRQMVGVSLELGHLFNREPFHQVLSQIETNPNWWQERFRMLEYWSIWLEDAKRATATWLTMANIHSSTTVGVTVATIGGREAFLSTEDFLRRCKAMTEKAYQLLVGCPFAAVYAESTSDKAISNLLGWGADRQAEIPHSQDRCFLARVYFFFFQSP